MQDLATGLRRCQLPATGIDINAAAQTNGAGDSIFSQNSLKSNRPFMGGGFTGVFMSGI